MSNESFELGRRELFVRATGALALGSTLKSIAGYSDTTPGAATGKTIVFKRTNVFTVAVEEPNAITTGAGNAIVVAGKNALLLMDEQGNAHEKLEIDGHPNALVFLEESILLVGFKTQLVCVNTQDHTLKKWATLDQKAWITSLAADNANVYVADAGNRIVLRFDMDGNLLNQIGKRDPDKGIPGFVVPSPYFDVAIDPMGALWAANPGKHGLESYRPDGSMITSWYRNGKEPEAFCGCCNPARMAFMSDYSLVTMEKGLNRVKAMAPDLTLRGLVTAPDTADKVPVDLTCSQKPPISGIAVDANDRILLLHEPEKSVHVYEKLLA